jgi:phosphatidylserine/phosphatidylglycerophosphate/cardiolipin synthase-like enzyme
MRLVILEDVPTADVDAAEKRNRGKLAFSNGAILGKSIIKYKSSAGGAKVTPIPHSSLDQWFVDEELARPTNNGHVFFVHSKVLLIDPLSDDPLVCSGSANFSTNSLVANDENMLLIRGNARVADIYMTELDRIFRHFRARDIINQTAADGSGKNPLLLDPTDDWIAPNFRPGTYKNNRRLLFFPDGGPAAMPWAKAAAQDPDPFRDEDERAAKARAKKNEKRNDKSKKPKTAKRPAGAKKSARKTAKVKRVKARRVKAKVTRRKAPAKSKKTRAKKARKGK